MQTKLTYIDPEIPLLDLVVYAKDQPQYHPLPTRRNLDGEAVVCVTFNLWARIRLLFGANFYLTMLTFNKPLTPIRVAIDKPRYATISTKDGKIAYSEKP